MVIRNINLDNKLFNVNYSIRNKNITKTNNFYLNGNTLKDAKIYFYNENVLFKENLLNENIKQKLQIRKIINNYKISIKRNLLFNSHIK